MQESKEQFWYVIQQEDGTCAIVESDHELIKNPTQSTRSSWGAFSSQQEAITKKIGLIRANKCKPE